MQLPCCSHRSRILLVLCLATSHGQRWSCLLLSCRLFFSCAGSIRPWQKIWESINKLVFPPKVVLEFICSGFTPVEHRHKHRNTIPDGFAYRPAPFTLANTSKPWFLCFAEFSSVAIEPRNLWCCLWLPDCTFQFLAFLFSNKAQQHFNNDTITEAPKKHSNQHKTILRRFNLRICES